MSKEEEVFAEVISRVVGVIAGALDDHKIMTLERFGECLRDSARLTSHSTSAAILNGAADALTGDNG